MTPLSVTTRVETAGGAETGWRTGAARALPSATIVVLALLQGWRARGSIAAGDWLGYAVLATLVLGVAAAARVGAVPSRRLLGSASGLVVLAGWDALSLRWSASPSLARVEALLTLLYAVALLVPAVSLRGVRDRTLVTAFVVFALGGTAVATGIELLRANELDHVYADGRLDFPISYQNAAAAFFLVGVWPALALAARHELPLLARAFALSAASAFTGAWALAQSKGGGLGLAVSAIVVLSVSRRRLRLLVPAAVTAALVGAAFRTLTAPYRDPSLATVHDAGRAELALAAAGLVAGVIYAALDRRTRLTERTTQRLGWVALTALVVALAAGVATFFVRVDHPRTFVASHWTTFKHLQSNDTAGSHFASLGSNRYDFWRVALDEFRHHPVAGIGSRGFRSAYLEHRRSPESPARAHSLELDALSETGIIGFALLATAVGLAVAAIARRARDDLLAIGALGALAYWLAHSTVDWTWSFPAIGVTLFVFVGTAAAPNEGGRPIPSRASAAAAVAAVALAIGAFGLPWLAAHYVHAAIRGSGNAAADLSRARRLDPLSVDPLLAQAALASTPAAALPPLEEAVRMEPRSPDLLFALGRGQLLAGHKAAGRATLRRALRLDPGDPAIVRVLRTAR